MDKKIAGVFVIVIVLISIGAFYYYSTNGTQNTSSTQIITQGSQTSGTAQSSIAISGAFALYPLMVIWAQQYESINPNVKISVSAGGAGKGISDVLAGQVDIAMVSRSATQAEINFGAYPIGVARAAAVAIVNANNPVLATLLANGVPKSTFQGIFIYGNVTSWGKVVGNALSPDNKIDVYTRSDSSGLADTWAKFLGKSQDDLQGVGVYGDPGMITAIQSDPLGIGYANIAFAYDNATGKQANGIAVIPIDFNNNGRIDQNENFYATIGDLDNAISSGAYPTPPSMDLYLVTKGPPTGASLAFIEWILTNGQQYIAKGGFVALPASRISQELGELQNPNTSTSTTSIEKTYLVKQRSLR